MEGKMPKVADASPGGRTATSAKKRRLEALERHAAQGSKRQGGPKPAKQRPGADGGDKAQRPAEQQQQQAVAGQAGRPNTYDQLPEAVWQGPVGAGLKAPVGAPSSMTLPPGSHFTRHLPLHLAMRTGEVSEDRAAADIGGQLDTNELLTFPKQAKGSKPPLPNARMLSGAALRRAGLQLQRSELTREAVEQLAGLWRRFAASLAGPGPLGASRLVRILEDQTDFHGCRLTVEAAANPRHVGVTGVVVRNCAAAVTLAALPGSESSQRGSGDAGEDLGASKEGSSQQGLGPMDCEEGASVAAPVAGQDSPGSSVKSSKPLRVFVLPKAGSVVRLSFPTAAGDAVLRLAGTALRVPGR